LFKNRLRIFQHPFNNHVTIVQQFFNKSFNNFLTIVQPSFNYFSTIL